MAFFPCIYFCAPSQMNFTWGCHNYDKMSVKEKTEAILHRAKNREYFYALAIKMLAVAQERGLRLIMENPWSENTYLKGNFILPPTLVDNNRMMRGDYFVKPTAYWFINAQPTRGLTEQLDKLPEKKRCLQTRSSKVAGLCSKERSMISADYARNFICDFILGKAQKGSQLNLFE